MPRRHAAALDPGPDVPALKRAMRARARRLRASIAESSPSAAAARAGARVIRDLVPAGDVAVAGYWAVGSELDCLALLEALAQSGIRCCLPVVAARGSPLVFRRWDPRMQLVPGPYGEKVPPPDAELLTPDFVIVPGLAFDRPGHRLGYGAGFYDRTLAALRARRPTTAVGFAYAGQLVDEIPRDGTDEPLDWIVTEAETIRCSATVGELRAY